MKKSPVSRATSPHYVWGEVCDGWRLVDGAGLSVLEEGEASLEVEGTEHVLTKGRGLEVEPGGRHRFTNRSAADVVFLVISAPTTKGDRVEE